MKIVFMGTPDFAVPSLKILTENNYNVILVITQPDKPKGRKRILSKPPIKKVAEKYAINVFQPNRIKNKESVAYLKSLEPDLFITCAFGQILSQEVLDIPKYGTINVHGSLLPQYRGACPLHWAIINGEKTTGITTMYTDVGIDTGDMLLKDEIKITRHMTVGQLHDMMSLQGAKTLLKTISAIQNNTVKRIPQDNKMSSYAKIITKEDALINWNQSAKAIYDLVRGMYPFPCAHTIFKDQRIKIHKTDYNESITSSKPCGTIIEITKDYIRVAAKSGVIDILEIQCEGSKQMRTAQYICGAIMKLNDRFGV